MDGKILYHLNEKKIKQDDNNIYRNFTFPHFYILPFLIRIEILNAMEHFVDASLEGKKRIFVLTKCLSSHFLPPTLDIRVVAFCLCVYRARQQDIHSHDMCVPLLSMHIQYD
jgi:hypothetical protein